jgi:hypothetical protein
MHFDTWYTFSPQKMDHCSLLFFGANEIESVHVYDTKKLMTEMDYQGHTCTTTVGEE